MRKIKRHRNKWWTTELQRLKSAYKKARKGSDKNKKIEAKIEYEVAISKAKQEAWKKFLESVEGQDDVYIKYKILCKEGRKSNVKAVIANGKYTNTFEETTVELNKANFPELERPLLLEQQLIEEEVEQYFNREKDKNEEEITSGEIETALAGMKINKAPGQDKIPTIVLKRTWQLLAPRITQLFNKIFKKGSFPAAWKEAKVIYIKKPGKEGTQPKDYRPITLLNVISKLYEKVIYNRLNWLSGQHNWIDKDQFGFQTYVSAEHANIKLTNEIFQAIKKRKEVTTIFADISGAFPSVWHEGLLYKMINKNIPREYIEFMRSYLKDRIIVVEKDEHNRVTKKLNRSVPQGSSIGPFAWSIMFDDLIKELKAAGYGTQAFADDLAVYKVKEKHQSCERTLNGALRIMESWGNKWMISFSREKTKTMTFSRLRNTDRDTAKLGGIELENVKEYKYLGLIYDCKLLWKTHIKQQVAKTIKTYSKMAGVSSLKWGLKEIVHRYIYKNVILPRIMYGALSWLSVIEQSCVKKILNRIQRIAAISITGTYRTTATSSATVLAGIMPIDLEIKQRAALQLHDIYRNKEIGNRLKILEVTRRLEETSKHKSSIEIAKEILSKIHVNETQVEKLETELEHPAKVELPLTELEKSKNEEEKANTIYTDASKTDSSRVGIAAVKWEKEKWQVLLQKSLSKENSV